SQVKNMRRTRRPSEGRLGGLFMAFSWPGMIPMGSIGHVLPPDWGIERHRLVAGAFAVLLILWHSSSSPKWMPQMLRDGHREKLERTINPLSEGEPVGSVVAFTTPTKSLIGPSWTKEPGDEATRRLR